MTPAEVTPAEAWAAKFPAPSPESDDSPAAKWAAKFNLPKDPSITHQEHLEAVGNAVRDLHANAAQLQQKLNPVPIPGMLDKVTPDPRNFIQRTLAVAADAAGKVADGPQQVGLGLARAAVGARSMAGMPLSAEQAATANPLALSEQGTLPADREVSAGLNQAIGGAFDAALPLVGAGVVSAPLKTAAVLAGGTLMQEGLTKGSEAVGIPKEHAELIGNIGGLLAGAKAHSAFDGVDSLAVKAWTKKFGAKAVEVPNVETGSSPSPGQTESPIKAEAPAEQPASVRSEAKPRPRAQSPFGADERVQETPEVVPVDTRRAVDAAPIDEALVRKRPLLDDDGEPLKTKAGKVREREFGTKIDLEQQPEIAASLDEKAAARAEVKGEAPEVRSATMRDHVAKLNESIAKGEPVHAVYDSSKVDHEGLIDPAAREAEHQARMDDPTLSQSAQKSFVPESYSRSAGGDVLVHGTSLDKWMSNGEKLQTMAAEAKLRTPYAPESAGVEMALDLRKPFDKLPKVKQNFWELARQGSPGSVFQKALEKRGVDPIDSLEQVKETLRLDRIEKILRQDEEPGVDAIRASAKTGTLKTPVDKLTPMVKAAKAKLAPKPVVAETKGPSLEDLLKQSVEQAQAKKAAKAEPAMVEPGEPRFTTEPAYGRAVNIAVPGEQTRYKARYALREAADVQSSHNPQSFEANPDYEHQNERDYSNPQNAARVVRDSSKDVFDPEFVTSESPTAEHGPTVVDARGNALGGNSRAMVVKRVYAQNGAVAAKYRGALEEKIEQFGISPDELQRFKNPVLVRERVGPVDATTEVADYNRKAAADLTPSEQAVADGKRISDQTMGKIMGNLESGERESLADALRGDNGAEILNALERDGVVSPQEKGGLVDDRGSLTPLAKDRIAKAMVGRMFESSADFERTTPEMRAKLEKIAPQVARVESREGWSITGKVREALSLVEEMRAAGTKNVEQYLTQDSMVGEKREYSPEAQAIAKTLVEKGQNQGAMSFRRYANEEANSRPGAPGNLFEPLTQKQAFDDAFVKRRGEAGSAPMLMEAVQAVKDKISGDEDGLKANYSGMGAIRSKFTPNAAELRAAAPDSVYAALRTATAPKQQATVKLIQVMPKIRAAIGEGDTGLANFKRVMVQDRLNATRETWEAWARDAQSMGDEQLVKGLSKGVNGLLWNMEGKNGLPGDLLQEAGALAENKDYAGLRDFLHETFRQAAANVQDVMSPEDFVEHSNKAGFQKALDIYKAELEPMLAKQAERTEGAFASIKGEFDTHYPLQDAGATGEGRISPFKEALNQQAGKSELGLGEYTAETKVLKDRLTAAFRTQDRAAAIDALTRSGMMQELTPGSEPGKVYNWNGKPLKASTFSYAGKTYETAASFAKDLEPIFAKGEMPSTGLIDRLASAGITYAITGLMEPVFHSKNILGTLISRTPFVSTSIVGKGAELFGRPFTQIVKLATTESAGDTFKPENMEAIAWLAKNGALGERFGSQTYSKALADLTGGDVHRFSLGPTLSGPKGIDMRARIELYKASMILEPNASVADRTKMVDQLGQYTRALWSEAQRALPDWTSSFHVAGTTMYGNALKTGLGAEGIGERGLAGRASGMLFRGALGTTFLWALTYKTYTDKWPWEDPRSKFLKIPVNSNHRYSPVGKALFGTGPEQGYIDFSYINPLAGRFGRAVGLDKAYETKVLGGSMTQVAEAAQAQAINSAAHPFMGPLLKAGFVAATGNEPYLTGLRDDHGRMAPQFFNITRSGGIESRAKAAFLSLNPFVENVGEATGMLSPDKVAKGSKAAQMVNDLLGAPFAKPSDPYRKQQFLERQQRGMERAQEKERK